MLDVVKVYVNKLVRIENMKVKPSECVNCVAGEREIPRNFPLVLLKKHSDQRLIVHCLHFSLSPFNEQRC